MVSLEIPGIVLGSPYLYDRKVVFHCHENNYHLFKYGIEYIVRAHKNKTSLSLIHAREMKRIVNASHNLTLLMIKHRDVLNQTFQKDVNACNEMFQDFDRFPLKGGKQDVKHLQ